MPKHLITGHKDEVTRLVLSADGRTLATVDKAGAVRVWDVTTGEIIFTEKSKAEQPVLAAGPRGRGVFVSGKDGFTLWDAAAGKSFGDGGEGRVFIAAGFSPTASTSPPPTTRAASTCGTRSP